MRLSSFPVKTMKEEPKSAELTSHSLMLRAGFIRQVAQGVFVYMPMFWRVYRKIEQIIREEADRVGALELMMPTLHPRELWDETGRWDDYTKTNTLFHLTDRKGSEMLLGPTHEEVITKVVSNMISSRSDMPVNFYQITTKFRDELRPRGGLIRAREFPMFDGYSFDVDQEAVDRSYELMRQAYVAAFTRCGLQFSMIKADSGPIGGSLSHEFMVECDAGEDTLLTCDSCDYAANQEAAASLLETPKQDDEMRPCRKEYTPDCRTVEDLERLFGMEPSQMVKTILYRVEYKDGSTEVVAVLMRGDLEINEIKLANSLGKPVSLLEIADPLVVMETTKAEVGFAGPVNLEGARVIADESVRPLQNFLCGANESDYHLLDVNMGRDFPVPEFTDLRNAQAGDKCAKCGGILEMTRGIEIGHLFDLGDKYSRRPTSDNPTGMSAVYFDDKGREHNILMGCYGIGLTRIAAGAIELYNDGKGIIWPITIAPYHVVIVVADVSNEQQMSVAEELYSELQGCGAEVVLDDRQERIGYKLNDADLIGYPYKLIVGNRSQARIVELKDRRDGKIIEMSLDSAADEVTGLIDKRLKEVNEGV